MIQPSARSTTQRRVTTANPSIVRVFGDDLDLDVDAEGGALSMTLFLKPASTQVVARAGRGGSGLAGQVDADGVVAGAGCGDDDGEEQSEGVGDDAAFASGNLLAGVDALAGQWCVGGGLHALGVDHFGRWLNGAPGLGAGQVAAAF